MELGRVGLRGKLCYMRMGRGRVHRSALGLRPTPPGLTPPNCGAAVGLTYGAPPLYSPLPHDLAHVFPSRVKAQANEARGCEEGRGGSCGAGGTQACGGAW